MKHTTKIRAACAAAALALAATATTASAEDAYIESDGSQFINTGYHVKPESRIELDFAFGDFASTAEYAQARLFDNDANNSKPSISASVYVSGEYSLAACIGDCDATYSFAGVWTVNSGEGTRGAYCDATKRTIVLDEFGKRIALKEGGEEVWCNDQSSARQFTHVASLPLGLFGRTKNASGTACDYQSRIRVFGFRVYESDALVHDYAPVVKGGVAGLLDAETGTFLFDSRTSGAGTFAYGGDIEVLDDDPYVESDGTDAINLGVVPSPQLKIEVDYALADATTTQQRIVGQSVSNPSACVYVNGSRNIALESGDTWVADSTAFSTGIAADTNRRKAVIDNPALMWSFQTGVTTNWSVTVAADITTCGTRPLALFGEPTNDAATAFKNFAKAKVYGLRIWQAGTLVRDLAPRSIDGTAGFEDLVTGAFYTCGGLTASANAPTALSGRSGEGDAFIESDGSLYSVIDTRYFPSGKTKVEVDFQFVRNAASKDCLLGNYGSTFTVLVYAPNGGNFNLEAKDGTHATLALSNAVKSDVARHTAVIDAPGKHAALYDANGALQGEADFPSTWTHGNTANWPLTLFGSANTPYGKTRQNAVARIFSVKISESDDNGATYTPVHTFLPCVKGGIPGFLDEVSGAFVSGGNLVAGGAVREIDDDPYVASPDGGCLFDTGCYVTSNTCVEIDYMPLVQQANQQFPFEAGARDGTRMFMRTYANGGAGTGDIAYFCGNTDNISLEVPFSPNVRRVLTLDAYHLKVKVETTGKTVRDGPISSAGRVPGTSASTLKIFSNAAANDHYTKGRLYGFKIYEEGELVRDYVPICQGGTYALVDKVAGKVLAKAASSAAFAGFTGNTALNDAFFAAPMRAEDAYIESDGTQAVNLGYLTTPYTRYEIDYQLTEIVGQSRPFGEATSALSAELYIQGSATGSGNVAFGVGDSWNGQYTNTGADADRHVAVLDLANRECGYSGYGLLAFSGETVCSRTATFPMWLFAKGTNADGGHSNRTKMRLYAFRIYEAGTLVHEYLPYKVGDTVGLYDTMTGEVKTSDIDGSNAFACGGGLGYGKFAGALTSLVVAPADTLVGVNRVKTLSAYAPGAVAYVWTRDGEPLEGVVGETCDVAWEKPSRAGAPVYAVTPVFAKGGETVYGNTATAEVTMAPAAFVLVVR